MSASAERDWRQTSLRYGVRRFAGGSTPSADAANWTEPPDGTPFVSIGDMSNVREVAHTARSVTTMGRLEAGLTVRPPGTVLYSMYASLGLASRAAAPLVHNQAILAIYPDPNIVDADFLLYWLDHMRPRVTVEARSNTQANLSADVVSRLPLTLPPLEVQRRIVNYLDIETARIDTLIAKNERAALLVEERRRAEEWGVFASASRRVPLKYLLAARPSYGILKPSQVDEGVPVVRIVDVDDRGHISLGNCIHVPEEQSSEYKRTLLRKGDVVVSVVGTIGRSAVVDRSAAGANISRALARLQPVGIRAEVLAAWIRSTEFARLVDITTTGTAQRVLNMEDLVEFAAPVSDREAEFLDRLRSLQDQHNDAVDALARQRTLLVERRQALITAAVTGEFEI